MRRQMLIVVLCAWAVAAAAAERPLIANAKVVTRSAAAGLKPAVAAILAEDRGPAWIGYAAPSVHPGETMCCFDRNTRGQNCCGGCLLENDGGSLGGTPECTQPLPSSVFAVFLRIEAGAVHDVRTFGINCALDAGGTTVYWLEGTKPVESVRFLESLLADRAGARPERRDGVWAALAMHDNPAADTALEKYAQPGLPPHLREQAAFWLGNARGDRGLDILLPLLARDTDRRFRQQAVFAVSQSSNHPRAINELMRLARQDPRDDVREQALFWLAQEAGKRAAGVITAAIEDDPETAVKRQAVFALTQMPDDEGIPQLIERARSNRNPVVREQAVFWLGQSHDPRALDFIESILKK